jgi:hypothetical protein
MSRRRGRPSRQYRLRVRTVRRDPIDHAALARAALEQAALDQRRDTATAATEQHESPRRRVTNGPKDPRHDRLA